MAKLAHVWRITADCHRAGGNLPVSDRAGDGRRYVRPHPGYPDKANLEVLRQRGVSVIGPAEGHLASG